MRSSIRVQDHALAGSNHMVFSESSFLHIHRALATAPPVMGMLALLMLLVTAAGTLKMQKILMPVIPGSLTHVAVV